jgi:hypothetical protein
MCNCGKRITLDNKLTKTNIPTIKNCYAEFEIEHAKAKKEYLHDKKNAMNMYKKALTMKSKEECDTLLKIEKKKYYEKAKNKMTQIKKQLKECKKINNES